MLVEGEGSCFPQTKDEISMIDADLLELISGVASNLRGNRAAFGGLQAGYAPTWGFLNGLNRRLTT